MQQSSSAGGLSRRLFLTGAVGALAACERDAAPAAPPPVTRAAEGAVDPLLAAVGGAWRPAEERARDRWRHPVETLRFFGLRPGATLVEFWPGAGWWTQVLAPYALATGGQLYAAHLEVGPNADPADAEIVRAYRERFTDADRYGEVMVTAFGPRSGPVAPAGSADLVLFMRNLHNWMAAGLAEKAFADAFAALRPGGVLGIEQHRAAEGGVQDPLAATGYVQEAYVERLAEEAGFRFDARSEINANARDDRDHPFGVWTLPPVRRTSPRGEPDDISFDSMPYDAVGESDRMTLRFRKAG